MASLKRCPISAHKTSGLLYQRRSINLLYYAGKWPRAESTTTQAAADARAQGRGVTLLFFFLAQFQRIDATVVTCAVFL